MGLCSNANGVRTRAGSAIAILASFAIGSTVSEWLEMLPHALLESPAALVAAKIPVDRL